MFGKKKKEPVHEEFDAAKYVEDMQKLRQQLGLDTIAQPKQPDIFDQAPGTLPPNLQEQKTREQMPPKPVQKRPEQAATNSLDTLRSKLGISLPEDSLKHIHDQLASTANDDADEMAAQYEKEQASSFLDEVDVEPEKEPAVVKLDFSQPEDFFTDEPEPQESLSEQKGQLEEQNSSETLLGKETVSEEEVETQEDVSLETLSDQEAGEQVRAEEEPQTLEHEGELQQEVAMDEKTELSESVVTEQTPSLVEFEDAQLDDFADGQPEESEQNDVEEFDSASNETTSAFPEDPLDYGFDRAEEDVSLESSAGQEAAPAKSTFESDAAPEPMDSSKPEEEYKDIHQALEEHIQDLDKELERLDRGEETEREKLQHLHEGVNRCRKLLDTGDHMRLKVYYNRLSEIFRSLDPEDPQKDLWFGVLHKLYEDIVKRQV